jgi:hypothetical protein
MSEWTPERYLDLARLCRSQAARGYPPGEEYLLKAADEYEAKARVLEAIGTGQLRIV